MAAQIFKDAAERFGWIIASSDNTRSDGPWEPNRRAVAAMWPDVLTRYSVDARRIYIAGFSGGAGVATVVATSTGHVSGIIAAGAPDTGESEKAPPVAWFGAAGRLDFNFMDASSTDERMRRAGNPRRLEVLRRRSPMDSQCHGDARGWMAGSAGDERRPACSR